MLLFSITSTSGPKLVVLWFFFLASHGFQFFGLQTFLISKIYFFSKSLPPFSWINKAKTGECIYMMTLNLSNVQFLNERIPCVCYYQIRDIYLQSHAFHLIQSLSHYLHFNFSIFLKEWFFYNKNNFGFDILYLSRYLFNVNGYWIPSISILSHSLFPLRRLQT